MVAAQTFILDLTVFLFSIFFLVKGTNFLTSGLERMSKSNNKALYALTSFFSAIATSLPELMIAVSGAIAGKPKLAVGLILGSNIADITVAIGFACLVGGSLSVVGDFVKKDLLKTLFMSLLPVFFALDGEISRIDGIQLFVLFVFYYVFLFRNKNKYRKDFSAKPFSKVGKWIHGIVKKYDRKQTGFLIIGAVMLLYSSDMVVQSGTALAFDMNLPIIIIGMFFAALGTSLPELVFGINSLRKKKTSMVMGNLLGSLVANSTLILGLTAIISPIKFENRADSSVIAVCVYILSYLLLWFFIRTKYKLQRWEGAILTIIYILFAISEFGF